MILYLPESMSPWPPQRRGDPCMATDLTAKGEYVEKNCTNKKKSLLTKISHADEQGKIYQITVIFNFYMLNVNLFFVFWLEYDKNNAFISKDTTTCITITYQISLAFL